MNAMKTPLTAALVALVAIAAIAAALPACSPDPVHDDAVDALGPEAPGVRPGPTHRPGQPCLVCHGGSGPADATFSVAGTVYAVKGDDAPISGATVRIVDGSGHEFRLGTNDAGNFYMNQSSGNPFGFYDVQVGKGGLVATMHTHVGRENSCAGCHTGTPGPSSPGPVYVALEEGDLAAQGVSP